MIQELEKEKDKVQRLEEDKASLKRKLDRVLPKQGSGFNVVEEELRTLKVCPISYMLSLHRNLHVTFHLPT